MMRKEGRRPNSPASFYKIILPSTLVDNKLRIPEKFVAAHGDELSTVVTLIIPDGCSWKVGMEKAEEVLWFCDGWLNLVDHYSISPGNFFIFKYQGHSTFNVSIYDIASTEIHYPSRIPTTSAIPNHCQDILGSDTQKSGCYMSSKRYRNEDERVTSTSEKECIDCDCNLNDNGLQSNSCEFVNLENNVGKTKFHRMKGADPEKGTPRRRHKVQYGRSRHSVTTEGIDLMSPSFGNGKHYSGLERLVVKNEDEEATKLGIRSCFTNFFMATKLTSQERDRANHAARMFTFKNPSFVVILRRTSLRPTYLLEVPSEFCESYMRDPGTKVELELLDERWPVFTVRRTARSLSLSRGWAAFANKHCLSIGDICVFELVQANDILLKVSIFRANEDAKKHAPTRQRSTDTCKGEVNKRWKVNSHRLE